MTISIQQGASVAIVLFIRVLKTVGAIEETRDVHVPQVGHPHVDAGVISMELDRVPTDLLRLSML